LPLSATVCSVSASSAAEPVRAAAVPFATAIATFAASAARTLRRLSSGAAMPQRVLYPNVNAKADTPGEGRRTIVWVSILGCDSRW
jgi:hypothetical protein